MAGNSDGRAARSHPPPPSPPPESSLTEIAGEEKGLCGGSPFLKEEAVVGLPLHAECPVASRELVEAALCLFQL